MTTQRDSKREKLSRTNYNLYHYTFLKLPWKNIIKTYRLTIFFNITLNITHKCTKRRTFWVNVYDIQWFAKHNQSPVITPFFFEYVVIQNLVFGIFKYT